MNSPYGGGDEKHSLSACGLPASASKNAHTIAAWLNEQEETSRLALAQSIFSILLRDASRMQESSESGTSCQKLCGFVQQYLKSKDGPLRLWAFSKDVALALFEFYLEWYESDPQRSMRLVPDVLVIYLTRHPDPEASANLRRRMLETLVSVVGRRSTKSMPKAALQLLSLFLSKRAVTALDISVVYRELELSVAVASELDLWRSLVLQLLSLMEISFVCPLVGKTANLIFRDLRDPKQPLAGFTVEIWQAWLQDAITQNPNILEDMKNYILMPLFQADRPASLELLETLNRVELPTTLVEGDITDPVLVFRLSALELGKKSGLVDEPNETRSMQSTSTTKIPLRKVLLESLLVHPSKTIRSCAFSLLVCASASTTPLSTTALDLLVEHLAPFYADYDAKFRNEIQGYSNKLVRRIKNVISVARRSHQRLAGGPAEASVPNKIRFGPESTLKNADEAKRILDEHEKFLNWFLDFLKQQLVPTASYQRHISGLKSAIAAVKMAKPEASTTSEVIDSGIMAAVASDPTWTRLLFDRILDPFDDVREASIELLALFPHAIVNSHAPDSPHATLLDQLEEFSARARVFATKTGRADYGDGAARSQGLLCSWSSTEAARLSVLGLALDRLESKLAKAELDLGRAAIDSPVHGDFASINYIWQVLINEPHADTALDTLHGLQRRMFDSCQRIWATVRHVLCDDSPEGHLPEELEEIEGLDTKDLLSYSFRAVHESSNLLRLLIGTLRDGPNAGTILPTFELFKDIGNLTFDQLSTLRHRGAFSTVSLTFTTCCQLTKNLRSKCADTPASDSLLRGWYDGALHCIMNQASTTRRSAGIPALTSGILAANSESPSFKEVFLKLEEIARKPASVAETDGSNLPQVHALNCLRDVFRSSLLSKRGESYLPETLRLAANNLRSEVWAIRNCGLLLLRSLIDVLIVDAKNNPDASWDGYAVRISYVKYHTLPAVLLDLLKSAEKSLNQDTGSSTAEAVFPALDIIRRAGPPEEHRDELCRLTEAYLGSHVWHVREIAARTLCSFFMRQDWVKEADRLLQGSKSNSNRLHGVLMTLKFLVHRKVELNQPISQEQVTQAEDALNRHVLPSGPFKACPEIRAAFQEILNFFMARQLSEEASTAQWPELSSLKIESALLDIELVTAVAHETFRSRDVNKLSEYLLQNLKRDTNTACRMLEAIPEVWNLADDQSPIHRAEIQSHLCAMYLKIPEQTTAPEPRTLALVNLAALLEALIRQNELSYLLDANDLVNIWRLLHAGAVNPGLSCAILGASGPIMAAIVCQSAGDAQKFAPQLRSWGSMISKALDVDETFDTRMAAVEALESFVSGLKTPPSYFAYLPFLSAVYDALNDDDEDIRDLAAIATSAILKTPRAAFEATESLLHWLQSAFKDSLEFRAHVVCRMTGHPARFEPADLQLASPAVQLQEAMDFDDSLFAKEEQNLFIDELRETKRWCRIFKALEYGQEEAPVKELSKWVDAGLAHLIQVVEREDDGPLGWSSDQHVFAICSRIVMCASVVVEIDGLSPTNALVQKLGVAGERRHLHGFLASLLKYKLS